MYVHTCIVFLFFIYNAFRTNLKIMYFLLANYLSEKRILFFQNEFVMADDVTE